MAKMPTTIESSARIDQLQRTTAPVAFSTSTRPSTHSLAFRTKRTAPLPECASARSESAATAGNCPSPGPTINYD